MQKLRFFESNKPVLAVCSNNCQSRDSTLNCCLQQPRLAVFLIQMFLRLIQSCLKRAFSLCASALHETCTRDFVAGFLAHAKPEAACESVDLGAGA